MKNKKLYYHKVKLFFIKARKKSISYKIELHKNVKIYLIFYLLLLKLVDSKTLI